MNKVQPKEISDHFKGLAKRSWEVRREKILNGSLAKRKQRAKKKSFKVDESNKNL